MKAVISPERQAIRYQIAKKMAPEVHEERVAEERQKCARKYNRKRQLEDFYALMQRVSGTNRTNFETAVDAIQKLIPQKPLPNWIPEPVSRLVSNRCMLLAELYSLPFRHQKALAIDHVLPRWSDVPGVDGLPPSLLAEPTYRSLSLIWDRVLEGGPIATLGYWARRYSKETP